MKNLESTSWLNRWYHVCDIKCWQIKIVTKIIYEKKNRIIVAYNFNINKKFTIVQIFDWKFSMRFSCNDVLIFIDVYFEIYFIHVNNFFVQNIVFFSCDFVKTKNFCYNFNVINVLSIDNQKLLF